MKQNSWCPDVVLTDKPREYQMMATIDNMGMEKHPETMCVIVLSYNRPKMLKEALMSLGGANQIIIVDDGSDFEPMDIVKELGLKNVQIVIAPKASFDIRIGKPRLGKMINYALYHLVETTLITYLCDDDLFADGWLNDVKEWMHERPACHIVKGRCDYFEGNDKTNLKGAWLGGRGLTSGNFVHRIECIKDECVRWSESRLISIDDLFLWEIYKFHNTWMIPFMDRPALYRRIHENALSAFSCGYELTDDGRDRLKARVSDGFSDEGNAKLHKKIWME